MAGCLRQRNTPMGGSPRIKGVLSRENCADLADWFAGPSSGGADSNSLAANFGLVQTDGVDLLLGALR